MPGECLQIFYGFSLFGIILGRILRWFLGIFGWFFETHTMNFISFIFQNQIVYNFVGFLVLTNRLWYLLHLTLVSSSDFFAVPARFDFDFTIRGTEEPIGSFFDFLTFFRSFFEFTEMVLNSFINSSIDLDPFWVTFWVIGWSFGIGFLAVFLDISRLFRNARAVIFPILRIV